MERFQRQKLASSPHSSRAGIFIAAALLTAAALAGGCQQFSRAVHFR